MGDARELIARELRACIVTPAGRDASQVKAELILAMLAAAGIRLIDPDELDPVTLERAAEVAANWGSEIPAEIRALGRKA